jgi:hypothetical protein
MTETRHAFIVPNTSRVVPVVNGETSREQMSKAAARARGFTVHAWPLDAVGLPVDADSLADHLPQPDAVLDPAIAAKWDARLALLATPEARAQPDAVNVIRDVDMSLDRKRAFLRGLPDQSPIQSEREPMMNPNKDTPEGRADRLIELKVLALSDRAARGDMPSKIKFREVNRAAAISASTGRPLRTVLDVLKIAL